MLTAADFSRLLTRAQALKQKMPSFFNIDYAKGRLLFQNCIHRENMNKEENPGNDQTMLVYKFLCLSVYVVAR
jgi:hypothetical protein